MEEKYGKDVEFIIADINTPEGQSLAAEYQVNLIPAFFVLNAQGTVLYSDVGFQPQAKLEPYIADTLK